MGADFVASIYRLFPGEQIRVERDELLGRALIKRWGLCCVVPVDWSTTSRIGTTAFSSEHYDRLADALTHRATRRGRVSLAVLRRWTSGAKYIDPRFCFGKTFDRHLIGMGLRVFGRARGNVDMRFFPMNGGYAIDFYMGDRRALVMSMNADARRGRIMPTSGGCE